MPGYTKEDIVRIVRDEKVEFIRLQFTDIFGMLEKRGDHVETAGKGA